MSGDARANGGGTHDDLRAVWASYHAYIPDDLVLREYVARWDAAREAAIDAALGAAEIDVDAWSQPVEMDELADPAWWWLLWTGVGLAIGWLCLVAMVS